MRVTQLDIAKEVGVDVSTVNKILNRKPGSLFRKETIADVFKVAKDLGYDSDRMIKGNIEAILREVFPPNVSPDELRLHFQKLPDKRLREIQKRIHVSA